MKQIVKSISDIITNSSSEVFVLNKEDAKHFALRSFDDDAEDFIKVTRIDYYWLFDEGRYERDIIRKLTDIKDNILWQNDIPEENEWCEFIMKHEDELRDKVIGKYYIEIEDHYNGCEVDISKAKYESVYYDSRH